MVIECKIENKEIVIWRFLTLEKFCSMLFEKSLFYTSLDRFEDSYEFLLNEKFFKSRELKKKGIEITRYQAQAKAYKAKDNKRAIGANCWCMSEYEPEFFWKIYSSLKNGIVIKASIQSLIDSHENIERDIYIKKIIYNNFKIQDEKTLIALENAHPMDLASVKRTNFSHEQELRCLVKINPNPKGIMYTGENIKINLDKLIHEVRVSPKSEEWFQSLINDLLEKYNVKLKCQKSDLLY